VHSDAGADWEGSPLPGLTEKANGIMGQIVDTRPTTPLGLALQLRAIWEDFGPVCLPGTEGFEEEMQDIERRGILSALNAAEALAGLPVTAPARAPERQAA
jgi:hypothetical protein